MRAEELGVTEDGYRTADWIQGAEEALPSQGHPPTLIQPMSEVNLKKRRLTYSRKNPRPPLHPPGSVQV